MTQCISVADQLTRLFNATSSLMRSFDGFLRVHVPDLQKYGECLFALLEGALTELIASFASLPMSFGWAKRRRSSPLSYSISSP